MDDDGQQSASCGPALPCDDGDPGPLDLGVLFRIAFAANCRFAGLADSGPCTLTAGELAGLCRMMFAAGFDAALEEIGYGG
jgi:hypothetical protein